MWGVPRNNPKEKMASISIKEAIIEIFAISKPSLQDFRQQDDTFDNKAYLDELYVWLSHVSAAWKIFPKTDHSDSCKCCCTFRHIVTVHEEQFRALMTREEYRDHRVSRTNLLRYGAVFRELRVRGTLHKIRECLKALMSGEDNPEVFDISTDSERMSSASEAPSQSEEEATGRFGNLYQIGKRLLDEDIESEANRSAFLSEPESHALSKPSQPTTSSAGNKTRKQKRGSSQNKTITVIVEDKTQERVERSSAAILQVQPVQVATTSSDMSLTQAVERHSIDLGDSTEYKEFDSDLKNRKRKNLRRPIDKVVEIEEPGYISVANLTLNKGIRVRQHNNPGVNQILAEYITKHMEQINMVSTMRNLLNMSSTSIQRRVINESAQAEREIAGRAAFLTVELTPEVVPRSRKKR